MERLAPAHVPVYETDERRRALWEQCAARDQPVVAVRDARRGYIVRYDLQHLGVELDGQAVRTLRERTRRSRSYPTETDPISEAEAVGGEAGPVSGDLHAPTESEARELAATLSTFLFDRSNWQETAT